ncbi:3549_t:CDS:1, partial [Ambispora gerdemannii]
MFIYFLTISLFYLDGLGGTLLPLRKNDRNFEGIHLDDPDISYRSGKIYFLIKDLIDEKVLLVRAPPYSGKTSLAQLIEYHLVSSSEYSKYRVIRVSMLWESAVGVNCSWETFGKLWKRVIGISWIEWVEQCQQIPTILILDKIQLIYKQERGIDESNETNADVFWRTVKGCLQEMSNIYIIMFGAYGYHSANSAGLSTP